MNVTKFMYAVYASIEAHFIGEMFTYKKHSIHRNSSAIVINFNMVTDIKGIYFVIYGIISEFTDKGQFQYLTNLKGPQEGTYLYTTQFLSLR